jgi:hypothetical protein
MNGWIKTSIAAGVILFLVFLGYLFFLNHVGINEIGVAYNSIGGKVWIQDRPGWYVTSPTVEVATISTLPIKVEIPSQAAVINAKMVKFNPAGIDEFIRLQGFSYYSNQGIQSILLGWAYSGKQMPFLDIIQDVGTENVITKPLNQRQ